jgi:hypothetical protein
MQIIRFEACFPGESAKLAAGMQCVDGMKRSSQLASEK